MGIDKKTLAVSKTYANKVALGFQSVTQTTTGFKITFKDGSTATYTVQNMHEHANKNVLDLLTKDANGNLLFDGKEITPDFLDTTGDGTKFLADDGTYKTVTSGTSYDDTEVRQLIADNTKNINTNKTNIVTNNINIATNKADIKSVNDKIGNTTLPTTATTLTGAIKEVDGNQLGNVSFSADYKNIVLNRKNGTNPYIIPISAIINHANFTELYDVDNTDIGNGKTIVYDATTGKHKYVDSTGTDEFVKMEADGNSRYLADLIDKQTIVNDNGILKVKKLDGQEVTIAEINQLKGLTMNVMELVGTFANGGVKVINTPLNTASELSTMDRSTFIDGISYIVYVLADENHAGVKTTYLVDKTNTTFFGNADSQRDFTTNPLDLANEVTGKLGVSNIDVDSLWALLTVDDTYKTLTTTDNIFGTHGAKNMYDELTTAIGGKANATDLTTHTDDTDIHVTSSERTKWDKIVDKVDTTDFDTLKTKVDKKVDKTSIITTKDNSATDEQIYSASVINTELNNKVNKTEVAHIKRFYSVPGNDWNNAIEEGYYSIESDTVANTIKNKPFQYAIQVRVITSDTNDINYVFQIAYVSSQDTRIYVRKQKGDGSWTPWGKVCITTVEDVSPYVYTSFETNTLTNNIQVEVKNGMCIISGSPFGSNATGREIPILKNMPMTTCTRTSPIISDDNGEIIGLIYIDIDTTNLMAHFYKADIGYFELIYPVAES